MKRILYIFFAAALTLASCKEECTDCDFTPIDVPKDVDVLYFHYLAMDNNLNDGGNIVGQNNVDGMVEAAGRDLLNGGVIYVFTDFKTDPVPKLTAIYYDFVENRAQQKVIREYEEDLDSSSPETFARVLADVRASTPRAGTWGLGFGSHGMGWLPKGVRSRAMEFKSGAMPDIITRTLLDDSMDGSQMEFDKLAPVIPDDLFDFIIMDLCYMGGIEFAYTLRDKADYLVLSPAEVIEDGMPYSRIIPYIFAEGPLEERLRSVCTEYNDFYLNYDYPGARFATISLFDCSEFDDFAGVMTEALGMVAPAAIASIDLSTLQTLDRLGTHRMFDMREFVYALFPASHPMRQTFDTALEELIPFRVTTGLEMSIGGGRLQIPKERYSGVSTYVPIALYADLNDDYAATEWYKAVYPGGTEEPAEDVKY